MAEVAPDDIKVAEVHDCFTIGEIMAIADLGFFPEGKKAATAAGEGKTARDGIKPVNVSGGLKCKGHPVGATGAAQCVEIFLQMRGRAGGRQVLNGTIDLALTQYRSPRNHCGCADIRKEMTGMAELIFTIEAFQNFFKRKKTDGITMQKCGSCGCLPVRYASHAMAMIWNGYN
jgi:hypothetical protein